MICSDREKNQLTEIVSVQESSQGQNSAEVQCSAGWLVWFSAIEFNAYPPYETW